MAPNWHASLLDRGFIQDGRVYRNAELSFKVSGRWCVLQEELSQLQANGTSQSIGRPALWKTIRNGADHRIFEFPVWTIATSSDDERSDPAGPIDFAETLDWALHTRSGCVPAEWRAPNLDLVRGWQKDHSLIIRAKGYVRQGELLLDDRRWAFRVPIVPELPHALSESRRRALADLAADAERHWAMIRVGVSETPATAALLAEVDLTGAPHSELLFSAGLDAIKAVVSSLLETADVLADPTVAIPSLALSGVSNTNAQKGKPYEYS